MSNNSRKHVEPTVIDDLSDKQGVPGEGIPGMSVSRGMPPNHEITHCTQCGKKFTPVRRPLTTWNSNFFGGFDVLCKQCVIRNERAAAEAVDQAERFFNKS